LILQGIKPVAEAAIRMV